MVLREETVTPYQTCTYIIERKLDEPHCDRNQINAQKIFSAVTGVYESFYDAEEKQGCGEPAKPGENEGDFSGILEKVMNVV